MYSEKEVERKLIAMVEELGGLCLKWVSPGHRGVPDRICLLPHGVIVFVELKREDGGEISKLQRWWNKRLTNLGFEHYFLHTTAEINALELIMRDLMYRRQGNDF